MMDRKAHCGSLRQEEGNDTEDEGTWGGGGGFAHTHTQHTPEILIQWLVYT